MNTELMNKVAAEPGRLAKEALLAGETDTRFLKWALDPAITFGITCDEDAHSNSWVIYDGSRSASDEFWNEVDDVCKALATRAETGHAALSLVSCLLDAAPDEDSCRWAARVLNKDLRAGVHKSTLQKVFPGLVEAFSCALATPYDADKHSLEGRWCAQVKLDGIRMIVVDGVAYSRTGKVLESVGHVLAELQDLDGYVFDGELMGNGSFDEGSGRARKKGNGPDLGLTYHVFDCIKLEEWNRRETDTLAHRIDVLAAKCVTNLFNAKHVKMVPYVMLPPNPTLSDITKHRDTMISDGYEGVMLKNLAEPYRFKRSNALLKFKFMKDADGTVVDVQEGKGKLRCSLGAMMVNFDGVITKVGSGFKEEQRKTLWENREGLIGKWVEVFYQDISGDGCLRFPVFHRFRPDKD